MFCQDGNSYILTGISLSAEYKRDGYDPQGNVFLHIQTHYSWIQKIKNLLEMEAENEIYIQRL